MPDLETLQTRPLLSDYKAQAVVEHFLKKAPAMRTIADCALLTCTLTARGFLCVNHLQLGLLFAKEGPLLPWSGDASSGR